MDAHQRSFPPCQNVVLYATFKQQLLGNAITTTELFL